MRRPPDPARVGPMLEVIRYRGPDDSGQKHGAFYAVGMRRLSIIDVEGGHQPIGNEDGTIWVVFNGEIYNYLELREDLERRGHRFRTHTDTEVLVHLYEEHGDGFPRLLNGMFGFALVDTVRQRVLLARDQFGIKPLYWLQQGEDILFASELKSLLAGALPRPTLEHEALAPYFSLGFLPGTSTAFRGVVRLAPAHTLVMQSGRPPIVQAFWSLADCYNRKRPDGPRTDEVEEVAALMEDAVRLRLRSDVPVGCFLSGGMDSSAITLYAARHLPRIDTFTVRFEGHYFDESGYARAVAAHCGTRHHVQSINPGEMLDELDRVAWWNDEPNWDPASVPSLMISRLARQHVKVALSGAGGDELFGGYRRHWERMPVGSPAARLRTFLPPSWRRCLFGRWPRKFRDKLVPGNEAQHMNYAMQLADADLLAVAAPWAASKYSSSMWFEGLLGLVSEADPVNQRLYADGVGYLADQVLPMLDRTSMAVSLEARVPFLDIRLFERMALISGADKVGECAGKRHLMAALRGHLPDSILDRPKLGFGAPLVRWINEEKVVARLVELPDGRLVAAGLLDRPWISGVVRSPPGREYHAGFLWAIIMLESWYRSYT